ncbi:MAG: hypothetical protein M1838_000071 [Thelocarpon superellum]|nr:MAG: hypothetical protein M1838_000071 [Thelocarpon superellum]
MKVNAARSALVLSLAGLVAGQAADFSIPSKFTRWDNENWTLSTDQLIQAQFQSRLNLANGYLGCAFAAAGPFFEADKNLTDAKGDIPTNGWPLDSPRLTFCSLVGFWDSQPNTSSTNFPWLLQDGGESVISGVPHWGGIIFEVGGLQLDATVDNTTVSNFQSTFSAKDGLATWSYTWAPSTTNGTEFNISYSLFLSRARSQVAAVRADIVASSDINATVTDLLDGRSAPRSTAMGKGMDQNTSSIYAAVSPNGLSNITAYIVSSADFSATAVDPASRILSNQTWLPSNQSTIGQTFDLTLEAGQTSTLYKFIGGASSDAFGDPQAAARNASTSAMMVSWDALLAETQTAWAEILPSSSIDDYADANGSLPSDPNVQELQVASVMSPYYLLQNTLRLDAGPGLDNNSIVVSGISSESYGGLVFWDADIFMSPGLVLSHPEYARTIANYRISRSGQARINAASNNFSCDAILFPWTSSRFGNCTATGPCTDYEYHINGDIAQMLLQHRNVTGDEQWWRAKAWPVYEGIAQMFSELLKYNQTTQKYDIKNMTDPDEYANAVDNGAYTLASASKVLTTANSFRALYGMGVNDTWTTIANNVAIPYDASGITTEYEGMNNSVPIKQADVVLNTYPLDYIQNYSETQSLNDLNYYAGKQSPDGPAMTYAIFSAIANAISPSGCSSFTYALDAFQPYVRAPWYQFSEQNVDNATANGGTNPAFPFLTGHGGFNQVGPFGWLGIRTDREYLVIDPALPPQIPQVKIRTFYYGGATLSATMNYTHTTLFRSATNNSFVNDTYGANPMPFSVGLINPSMHNISIGQTLTLNNRQHFSTLTTPDNLVQCQPVTSDQPFQQGQYPLAAIDGAASTQWQPLTPHQASMAIDMSDVAIQPIIGVSITWGTSPPIHATVYLSNSSSFNGNVTVIPVGNITISQAFNANDVVVKPYVGNSTNVSIANAGGVYSGRHAMLQIEGTQGSPNTTGATVAEFALIGTGGAQMVKRWDSARSYRKR